MAQTLSILAFVLFWLHLAVSIINIYFSAKVLKEKEYPDNLRGTEERLLEINPNYFLEKEIENPKELRNLSYDKKSLSALIINVCSLYFILVFSFTFCIRENECCHENGICFCESCKYCAYSCDDDCNCFWKMNSKGDGKGALGILVLSIFVGFYFAVLECGKTLSRIITIFLLFLINVALAVLSLCSGFDKFCILFASFSSFAALCDLIMVILIICVEGFGCPASNNQYYYPPSPQTQQLQVIQANTPTPDEKPYWKK